MIERGISALAHAITVVVVHVHRVRVVVAVRHVVMAFGGVVTAHVPERTGRKNSIVMHDVKPACAERRCMKSIIHHGPARSGEDEEANDQNQNDRGNASTDLKSTTSPSDGPACCLPVSNALFVFDGLAFGVRLFCQFLGCGIETLGAGFCSVGLVGFGGRQLLLPAQDHCIEGPEL